MIFEFGKYKGKSVGWVAQNDLAYGYWVRDCLYKDHPFLVAALMEALVLFEKDEEGLNHE
jgi:hypothetical protein